MYLLDTNVVSELRRRRPHGAVVASLQDVANVDLHIAAVTIGELQAGVELTRQQDRARASEIEAWVGRVADSYNVLPMDARIFRAWARLMHRRSRTLAAGRDDCRDSGGPWADRRDAERARFRRAGGADAQSVQASARGGLRRMNLFQCDIRGNASAGTVAAGQARAQGITFC
jgi:predicted nucleic acid-binding protein